MYLGSCMFIYIYLGTFIWRRQWHPTPVLLPGKSHGRRSLVGFSPWVAKSWTWLSDFTFTFHLHALEKEMATHCSVLAWRIPGTGEPGGLPSMGSHRVGHDWSDLAACGLRIDLIHYYLNYCFQTSLLFIICITYHLHCNIVAVLHESYHHTSQFSIYISLIYILTILGLDQRLMNLLKNNLLVTYHVPYIVWRCTDE